MRQANPDVTRRLTPVRANQADTGSPISLGAPLAYESARFPVSASMTAQAAVDVMPGHAPSNGRPSGCNATEPRP